MDKILEFVQNLLTYLKEGKAAFINDLFNKGDAAE